MEGGRGFQIQAPLSKLPEIFDVQIFQLLPLYIRIDVLKGKLIYCEDETLLHDVAWEKNSTLLNIGSMIIGEKSIGGGDGKEDYYKNKT